MKIFRIVYNEWTSEQIAVLKSYGIDVNPDSSRVDIEDSIYKELSGYFKWWGFEATSVGTLYDKKDIDNANQLVLDGVWVNGYPQPEDIPEYVNLTYDVENYCYTCGVGAQQNKPFVIKKEPKWGKNIFFELNWVFDELFVRRDIYDEIFAPLGLDYLPVLLSKTMEESQTSVQLKVTYSNSSLDLKNQPSTVCEKCGRIKYSAQIAGFFPTLIAENQLAKLGMIKCQEYFGSSASAHQKLFIDRSLLNKIMKYKPKISLMPTAPTI